MLLSFFIQLHSSLPDTAGFQTSEELYQFQAHIECEHPMPDLYKYVTLKKLGIPEHVHVRFTL